MSIRNIKRRLVARPSVVVGRKRVFMRLSQTGLCWYDPVAGVHRRG